MKMLEYFFSVKNTNDKRHKVINILGLKIKTKSKKYYKITSNMQITSPMTYLTDLYSYYNREGFDNYKDYENLNSVTIVVPIYNGIEHLKTLVPNLIKNTSKNVKIILLNDCSTDPAIQKYLDEKCNYENITIINNEENLGFVKTTNKGMSLVKTKYAVWVNSDVIVPEFWLERLLDPFNNYDKIATTTPFTNSGVTFSFPIFCKDNKQTVELETIDKCFQHIHNYDLSLNETYSGTGFCMAINMDCWAEIGNLDDESFGKGYGEENDWCFRALREGWKHFLVPNLYVQHKHGGSFDSKEKKKLVKEHFEILRNRYSNEINVVVPKFMKNDPWKKYRQLAFLLSCQKNPVLVIDLKSINSDKSGAVDYRKKLVNELSLSGYNVLILQYERCKNNEWSLTSEIFSPEMEIKLKTFADIKILFEMISVRKVIINNFAFLGDVENTINILCKLKDIYNFKMSYKFHDYLSICPSFFLVNDELKNCNSYVEKNQCKNCLKNNGNKTLQRFNIETWRAAFDRLFKYVDEFNFFSEYTLNIVKNVYPIVTSNYSIKEHEPLFSENYSEYDKPEDTKQITIAFVGNFCKVKGSQYFVNLANLCRSRGFDYKFIIIGIDSSADKYDGIEYKGGYNRDSLGEILTENQVHAVVYSSINNETFSYLAQELMILNVPFICFSNGAHSERIKKYQYQNAEISDDVSEEGLYTALTKLLNKVYFIQD